MKRQNIQNILGIVSLLAIISLVIIGDILGENEEELLAKEGIKTYAIVFKKNSGIRSNYHLHYNYIVNGKNYKRNEILGFKQIEGIHIGDTVIITYAKRDPDVTRLLKDNNGFIIIKGRIK